MKRVFDILHSFFQLTFRVILSRRGAVLFYYPQHFNRTAAATNPFFDPLLQACDEVDLRYHLLEEPDWGTDKPRNPRAIKADALFVLTLALHKLQRLCGQRDFYKAERIVGRIVNVLTLGRLRRTTYITLSGSMLHLFAALNPQARVYDVQHGIIGKKHVHLFDEHERLRTPLYPENYHWLLWGEGYRQTFIKGEEERLAHRTHVMGYPLKQKTIPSTTEKENVILLSLQFTADYDQPTGEAEKKLIGEHLEQLVGKGYRVLVKHHPRYNYAVRLDDWFARYDFLEETTSSLDELCNIVKLQLVVHSTTTFEYAACHIPSFVMYNATRTIGYSVFYEQFSYPLYHDMSLAEVLARLANPEFYKEDGNTAAAWYTRFYTPFDKKAFLRLINPTK